MCNSFDSCGHSCEYTCPTGECDLTRRARACGYDKYGKASKERLYACAPCLEVDEEWAYRIQKNLSGQSYDDLCATCRANGVKEVKKLKASQRSKLLATPSSSQQLVTECTEKKRLEAEVAQLTAERGKNERLQANVAQLTAERDKNERLQAENEEQLTAERDKNERLQAENEKLLAEVDSMKAMIGLPAGFQQSVSSWQYFTFWRSSAFDRALGDSRNLDDMRGWQSSQPQEGCDSRGWRGWQSSQLLCRMPHDWSERRDWSDWSGWSDWSRWSDWSGW